MKIELKNVKFSETFSEETNCFKATIYCDGKKVGYCENEGHGGCTSYYGIEKYNSEDIQKMEEYCKSLPPIVYDTFTFDSTLETVIDKLFEDWLNRKENKKLEKQMEKGILIGTKYEYQILSFKKGNKKINLSEMFNDERGVNHLQELITKLKSEGKIILNTNIPQYILN
jgi:hypothetical protein